jgi:hypothetical protein
MKYRPREPETRLCVRCHKPYVSAHQRRIYCGNSCANQVSYARKPRPKTLATSAALGATPKAEPAAVNLAPTWQNAAILTGSHVAANLVLVLGERLLKLFTASPATTLTTSPSEPIDPASWLPAALLSAPAPRLTLTMPWWDQPQVFLQLAYFGHTFYYQPTHQCLLWRAVPGQVLLLSSPELLAAVLELTPNEQVPVPPAEIAPAVPAALATLPQALPTWPSPQQVPARNLFGSETFAPDQAPFYAPDQAPPYA